jgi:uncharacterized RDD family membrane protein YckC
MSNAGPGTTFDVRPHAYDPVTTPEYFEGVLARRAIAFLIDLVVITVPLLIIAIFFFVAGFVTFGLAWFLFWLLSPLWWPAAVIWIVVYYGSTLGGENSATIGMRVMDLQMRTWYGAPCYFVLGAAHAVVFWITISVLTPFVLLVGFFNDRRRLLHDIMVGTVVINDPARARIVRAARPNGNL